MKKSNWRYAPYGVVAASAVGGQISAGVIHLRPTHWTLYAGIALVAVAVEGAAIWMAYQSKERAEVGENARPFFIISAVFATVAIFINVAGHWGFLWAIIVFGGLSAAGFVIWCFELRALMEDSWDKDRSVRSRAPSVMVLKKFSGDERVANEARNIALIFAQENPGHPGLGPARAIEMARAKLEAADRTARIGAAIRAQMEETKASKIDVELALMTFGVESITQKLMDLAGNDDMAGALYQRIAPGRMVNSVSGGKGGRPRKERTIEGETVEPDGGEPDPEVPAQEDDRPSRKAIGASGRRRDAEDPWDKLRPQLLVVMANNPDWYGRPTPITGSGVEGALAHAVANGRLDQNDVKTSKPYVLMLKWMVEALSSRPVPEEQWTTGSLKDVDRGRVETERAAYGVAN